ncbi:hypothetical protein [Nocardia blacklockiae]|nr:hypothetical protein [Nocardia blacklockiae]MBF6173773.1 hypothetical protein [Nocardia blacklockiae]
MPDLAVTASVLLGYLLCALGLRTLAATGTPARARVARGRRTATRAMMDE